MPFRIDLRKTQKTKRWHSVVSPAAQELQALYDQNMSAMYAAKLIELRQHIKDEARAKAIAEAGPLTGDALEKIGKAAADSALEKHDFRLTDGKIFEITERDDSGKIPKISVQVQLMVKGSSITWSFNSPKDETYQSWRDEIFKTAAIAHQSVTHGCDSYYRGSNAYHIKKMHAHEGESAYNHNHYRIVKDRPVTPEDLSEHLNAFYDQALGKKFIKDQAEINDILLKYKIFWSEDELDPRYSRYYPLINRTFGQGLLWDIRLKDIHQALDIFLEESRLEGRFVTQAYKRLAEVSPVIEGLSDLEFAKLRSAIDDILSHHFKEEEDIAAVLDAFGFKANKRLIDFILAYDTFVRKVSFNQDFILMKGFEPPTDSEVHERDEYTEYYLEAEPSPDVSAVSSSVSAASIESEAFRTPSKTTRSTSTSYPSPSRGSPSEQYKKSIDQIMNIDDRIEYMLFAEALTNRCRSIDDAMLGEITPQDFRTAIRLYNALKFMNQGKVFQDETLKRFPEELYTELMQKKDAIVGLESSETDLGPALPRLIEWIKTAPPKLEQWLKWVEENGSRGLGSEIAHSRELSGEKRQVFRVGMDDRSASVASIFNLKPASDTATHRLQHDIREYITDVMHLSAEPEVNHKIQVAAYMYENLKEDGPDMHIDDILAKFYNYNDSEAKEAPHTLLQLLERYLALKTPPEQHDLIKERVREKEPSSRVDVDESVVSLASLFAVQPKSNTRAHRLQNDIQQYIESNHLADDLECRDKLEVAVYMYRNLENEAFDNTIYAFLERFPKFKNPDKGKNPDALMQLLERYLQLKTGAPPTP